LPCGLVGTDVYFDKECFEVLSGILAKRHFQLSTWPLFHSKRKHHSTKTESKNMSSVSSMDPALIKKLLLLRHPKHRISNDAVLLAGELLRLFVIDARQRAAVEVSSKLCCSIAALVHVIY
jgi:hypothetical protein